MESSFACKIHWPLWVLFKNLLVCLQWNNPNIKRIFITLFFFPLSGNYQADNLRQQTLQQMHRILTTRQSARALLAINDYFSRLRALSSLWLARPREWEAQKSPWWSHSILLNHHQALSCCRISHMIHH